MENLSIKKTFKDYYQEEAYRARHQAYMQAKILCPYCEFSLARANMTTHKRSAKHKKMVGLQSKIKLLEDMLATSKP